MEVLGGLLDQEKVVMDTSSCDECALIDRDKLGQPRSQAKGEHFGEKLRQEVDEADRPVVEERGSIGSLWQKNNKGFIELLEASLVGGVELVKRLTNVDGVQTGEEELCFESVRASRLPGR